MAARNQPSKFDLRREATRGELLRLGRERFPVRGYAETTIDDVVRGSTLSRGAYYFHFLSKGDLFLSCLEAREEDRAEWAPLGLESRSKSLDGALAELLGSFREVDGDHRLLWPLMETEFWLTASLDPDLDERFRALHEHRALDLTTMLEHLRDRGLISVPGQLRPIAEALLALWQGTLIHHQLYGVDDRRLVETFVRILQG
jgi:AcrR family transcriptional regulator